MGILAPPGSNGSELTDEELRTRKRFFFENRRHPGGGPV
jgi:hypothetical protein